MSDQPHHQTHHQTHSGPILSNNTKSDQNSEPMGPGHVDFVLQVCEDIEFNETNVANAMPVSKRLSLGAATLGLVLLFFGVGFLTNNASKTTTAFVSTEQIAGAGMMIFGCLLVAIAIRSFLFFLHEAFELVH